MEKVKEVKKTKLTEAEINEILLLKNAVSIAQKPLAAFAKASMMARGLDPSKYYIAGDGYILEIEPKE